VGAKVKTLFAIALALSTLFLSLPLRNALSVQLSVESVGRLTYPAPVRWVAESNLANQLYVRGVTLSVAGSTLTVGFTVANVGPRPRRATVTVTLYDSYGNVLGSKSAFMIVPPRRSATGSVTFDASLLRPTATVVVRVT